MLGSLRKVDREKAKGTDYRFHELRVANGWIYFATQATKGQDPDALALPEIRRMRLDGSDTQVAIFIKCVAKLRRYA